MITDINRKSTLNELDRGKLPNYWSNYFDYENDLELFDLSKIELSNVIEEQKTKERPFIDSQITISNILTEFGKKHNFHRQFHERHRNSDSGQVLGMQLYHLMLKDTDTWVYCEITKRGHIFPHATYFQIIE